MFLVDVQAVLEEHGVENVLDVEEWDGNDFDVGYIDGMEFDTITDADEMEGNLKKSIAIIHNTILEHGMEVNYKCGKTETIVSFFGKGNKVF